MGHTQGPWSIDDRLGSDWVFIEPDVCQIPRGAAHNAALLAAAPALLAALEEFVADCEAVGGGKYLGKKWPDLLITYNKAKRVLRVAKEQPKANVPVTYIMEPIGVDGADEAGQVLFYCSDGCRCAAKSDIDGSIQIGQSAEWVDGTVCDMCAVPLKGAQ